MRYLLVTDSSFAAPLVSEAAQPGETLLVLCEDRNLARRLRRRGYEVSQGSLSKKATWKRLGLSSEDSDLLVVLSLQRRQMQSDVIRRIAELTTDIPVVLLDSRQVEEEEPKEGEGPEYPNLERVRLTDIVRAPFQEQFSNAFVRKRVRQYREHFKDADRVLILTHDEPDPDGIAAALALRSLLGRNRQTAHIGTFCPPTRPENLQMVDLLGIDITHLETDEDLESYDRIAVVDTQPHIFGGRVPHADLVVDHHPLRTGYTATFKDIRTSFGSTCTLMIDYMLRSGLTVSQRLATAAVYAIKTDTWAFRRGAVAADVAIFAHVYPLADQAILRLIEGEGFTLETLRLHASVAGNLDLHGRFAYSHLGEIPREDHVPTVADLLLNLQESVWSAVSGILDDNLIVSVRNLGYQRSAGELVQQVYGDIASAGGHRSAAKAIMPMEAARERFGPEDADAFTKNVFSPLWEAAGETRHNGK